jgi:hypothetical protein
MMTVLALVVLIPIAGNAAPQNTQAKPTQNVPLEAQVVISRYQGEKRVSSLPYVVSLKAGPPGSPYPRGPGSASLRLGTRVPIRTQVVTPAADGKPATSTPSVTYENVGTNIDCSALALEDGRFEVTLTINESSVISDPQQAHNLRGASGMGEYPVLRSYQTTNTLFVKDGQTVQFTAASDRISGEVVRVEVKLTVLK